ncbi:MAG: methionine--tRNA ligase [SAR202 cluster bacterium]|nr:methionine--tRNA ligase [SAR202 cluster bacterium]
MPAQSEKVFIAVAWPYANGPLHLGHIAGCYLPADIFARYHRLKGNRVLMVSGSDQHGTPITVRAEQEGLTPQQVVDKYHASFLDSWKRLGITFDLFTTTGTPNHRQVAHDMFLTLLNKGYITKGTMLLPYCPTCRQFRPDRYIEGICPHCRYVGARGDQCDNCGRTLDPQDLIEPKCRVCMSTPEFRESEHFFLKLTAFEKPLQDWVAQQSEKAGWRLNVRNFTARYLADGLKDRAITRDISWGIPVPVPGFDSKRIYVWFEAVCGYLSAAKEWAQKQGAPDAWQHFWQDPSCRAYYFIGKDNIPFHTIIWPAMLMGHGGLNLPHDVPANEFLNLADMKFSTSRNYAVWLPDYLDKYEPDPLRYVLSAAMPETSDANFTWADYVRRNNQELVATYGNLVHRTLTQVHRNFDGKFPQPGPLDPDDHALLHRLPQALDSTSDALSKCSFRQALGVAMSLAQDANRYIDAKAPWKTRKTDIQRTATTLWVCLNVISCLRTITYPFLPFSAQKLHTLLGFAGDVQSSGWRLHNIKGGHPFPEPTPLFTKLDESLIESETAKLRSPT